ncbi:VOC family protein [Mariniflexile jejuense]|uniref:VOC family protein n=1 Tax=Mariniflexile jejuense TaxID=1173582 RepID=A0ABW3JHL9_9FLAO
MKEISLICLLILFNNTTHTQNNTDFSMTFNHVALSVKNLEQSAQFYKNTLNLKEITNKTKKDSRKWLSLGDGKELHLISDFEGAIIVTKAVHMALTTSDFDAFIEKLKSMHINYTDWEGNLNIISIRADGIKQVFFQDPDGYWIEVNSVGQTN